MVVGGEGGGGLGWREGGRGGAGVQTPLGSLLVRMRFRPLLSI